MEKVDLLVWSPEALSGAAELRVPGLRGLTVSGAANLPSAPLLMGRGPDLAGLVEIWLDSVDVWLSVVAAVSGDAYLVTESVPQPPSGQPGLLTHLTWFPKPSMM